MAEPAELTDEERELVKGMPPAVAAGFIAARRADDSSRRWQDLVDRGAHIMDSWRS